MQWLLWDLLAIFSCVIATRNATWNATRHPEHALSLNPQALMQGGKGTHRKKRKKKEEEEELTLAKVSYG